MFIFDFINICSNPEQLQLSIFDMESGEIAWEGIAENVPECFEHQEIAGFDAPEGDTITINVRCIQSCENWTFKNGHAIRSPYSAV